jgi:hypothetical protein
VRVCLYHYLVKYHVETTNSSVDDLGLSYFLCLILLLDSEAFLKVLNLFFSDSESLVQVFDLFFSFCLDCKGLGGFFYEFLSFWVVLKPY